MPKQEPINRTFGLERVQRCPQCDQLAVKVKKKPEKESKRQEICPNCQTEVPKDLAINTMPAVFTQFTKAVNVLIKRGITRPNHMFRLDSIKSVKRFYDSVSKDAIVQQVFSQLDLLSRVYRCAAQYAYFAIREYKRRVQDIQTLGPILTKELRQKGLTSLQGDQFPSRDLLRACWIKLRQTYGEQDQMSRYELINLLKHLRNLISQVIKARLQTKDPEVVQALTWTVGIVEGHLPTGDRLEPDQTVQFATNFVKQLSRLLTQRINRNKKNMRPAWGKGHFDDLIEEIMGQSPPLDSQGRITLKDKEWQALRLTWRNKIVEQLRQDGTLETGSKPTGPAKGKTKKLATKVLDKVKEQLTPNYIISQICKPRPSRFRYTKKLQEDFERYIVHKKVEQIKKAFLIRQQTTFAELVRQACRTVTEEPQKWLKTPQYEAQAIPLGIDDNRIYKLGQERDPSISPKKEIQEIRPGEIFVRLTLRPKQPVDYRITSPKRWLNLLDQDYTPQKPVLHKKPGGGSLVLAVPFKRPPKSSQPKEESKPPKPPQQRISTNVDLGLKVLAALSITQGVQPIKWAKGTTFKDLNDQFANTRVEDHELARYFLDQDYLSRPAKDWFEKSPPGRMYPSKNIKRHLFNLREEAKRLQSQKDTYRSKHQKYYRKRVKYKRLKREWKRIWEHISGIHEDMAKQIATRIVSVSQAYNSQVIRFEDLKWSQMTKKEDAGHWLATWQVYWFHSEIIRRTKTLAKRQGIKVELVVAKGTSYRCSSCGKTGERTGKMFYCPHCQRHLDSDVNAARNIAVAPISPDAIRVRSELPYPDGNAGEPSGS